MLRRAWLIAILWGLAHLGVGPAHVVAQEPAIVPSPVILTDDQGEYPLGLYLALLDDPTGQLTIEEVASAKLAGRFMPSQEATPTFGYLRSAVWLRFQLKNDTSRASDWWLEISYPRIDRIDLYIPRPDPVGFEVRQTGNLLPFASRDLAHHNFIFKLILPPQAQQTYYLRLSNDPSLTTPLTLWSPEAFAQKDYASQFGWGLFFGILLIMFGYNLFLFLSLHDRSYLYYVLVIAAIFLHQFTFYGFAKQFLWPNAGLWNRLSVSLFLAFGLIIGLKFTDTFLDAGRQTPRWHILLLILQGAALISLLITPFVRARVASLMLNPLTLTTIATIMILGVTTWYRGYKPARFFLLGWLIFLAGVFSFILVRINLTPSNLVFEAGPRTGAVLLMLLLSLALADRINLLKAEAETANRHLRASEHKYRSLFENSKDAIIMTTPDGQTLDINEAGLQLLGYSRQEVMQGNAREAYADPSVRDEFQQILERDGSVENFEVKLRRKDGGIRDVLFTATLQPAGLDGKSVIQTIARDITEQKQAETERLELAAIQQELVIAREIQQSLLPSPRPDWKALQVICYSNPAHEVGGDFYQYKSFSQNHFALAVGDVSGKGIAAALLMATSLSLLDASLAQNLTPTERMAHLDTILAPYAQPSFQNCAMCYTEIVANGEPAQLHIINAGCIPPYIKRKNGQVEQPLASGFALGYGLGAEIGYQQLTRPFSKGDFIILTSDGVVEAANRNDEILGFERLTEIIKRSRATNVEALLAYLLGQISAFTGTVEPRDDITIVAAQLL